MKKKNLLKHRFINKYDVDFWGYLASCTESKKRFFSKVFKKWIKRGTFHIKNFWVLRRLSRKPRSAFVYYGYIPYKRKVIKFDKSYILELRKMLLFRVYYGNMTIKKLKRYMKKVNRRSLDYFGRLCMLLECRLDFLLYRLNFVKNPKEANYFIRNKLIIINNEIHSRKNYQLYINDVITIKGYNLKKKFFNTCFDNFKKDLIIVNSPKYIEINYNLMKCIFIKYPTREDIWIGYSLSGKPNMDMNWGFLRNLI